MSSKGMLGGLLHTCILQNLEVGALQSAISDTQNQYICKGVLNVPLNYNTMPS